MKNFREQLIEKRACKAAMKWVENRTMKEALKDCHRGDWLLWMVQKFELCDIKKLTLIKVECAELVKHLIKDERSKNALVVARKFANGEATRQELNTAAAAAAYAAYAAYAYAYADAAAAAAAYAYAAAATDAAAAAAASDADAAREETLLKCANIVRKHIVI